jgi:uncharacterized protein YbcI
MPSITERPTGGSLDAAISTAVVGITATYTGRGPTRARTSIRDDLVVVLLQDTMTKVSAACRRRATANWS